MPTDDLARFFGAQAAALHCVQHTLSDAELIRIATAYFEASGYQMLQDTLAGKRIHLLVGRSEGGQDNVTHVLNEFEQELASGNLDRRTRALRMMLEALQQGLMTVGVGDQAFEQLAAMDARYLYHHAKLYIADERAAVVTSANFSHLAWSPAARLGLQLPIRMTLLSLSGDLTSISPGRKESLRY